MELRRILRVPKTIASLPALERTSIFFFFFFNWGTELDQNQVTERVNSAGFRDISSLLPFIVSGNG